jgi:hypothetical protein
LKIGNIIALTFFLTNTSVCGQIIVGNITDKETMKPIQYVSIGILDKGCGTYSEENGNYKLKLTDFAENDVIRFSCIGYKTQDYNLKDIKKANKDTVLNMSLLRKPYELKEIVVRNKTNKTIELGNRRGKSFAIIGFFGDKECGIIIKNSKDLLLTNVSFKLVTPYGELPDSGLFRFNVYKLKDGLPDANILIEPIYIHLQKHQFDEEVSFDLSKFNVRITEDFAATFELIKQYGANRIYFAAQFRGNQSIFRRGTQGSWLESIADNKKTNLYQSLSIDAICKE